MGDMNIDILDLKSPMKKELENTMRRLGLIKDRHGGLGHDSWLLHVNVDP